MAADRHHDLQKDEACSVLVMDRAGAVGLDLSFVSYVFLLEPIEDMSLYKQIVSRAHRLGAKAAVHVEILVMKVSHSCHRLSNWPLSFHIQSEGQCRTSCDNILKALSSNSAR